MDGSEALECGSAREGGAATTVTTLSLDEVFSRIGLGFFHYRLLLMCGFGFSAVAVEHVSTSFLLAELRIDWKLDEHSLALYAVSSSCGCIVGKLFWGAIADQYGRRSVYLITVVLVVIFGVLCALSSNPITLYILRFFVGFGLGGNVAVDFTMFVELLPTSERCNMLFYMAAFWNVGQVGASAFAWLVIPWFGWRGFLVACAMPSLLTSFFRPLIPESPRWLLLNGQEEEAMEVCRGIALCNGVKPEDVGLCQGVKLSLENAATSLMVASGKSEAKSPIFLVFSRPFRRTTAGLVFLISGLHYAQYATTTFLPSFLEFKGIGKRSIYQIMVFNSVAALPGLMFAFISSPILGRVLPMQFVLVPLTAALWGFSMASTLTQVAVSIGFASACMQFGWAVLHVYAPEVFPTELRASATGFISACGTCCSMMAPLGCAWLLDHHASVENVGLHFCVLTGSCSLLAASLLHVETQGQDLSDFALQLDRSCGDKYDSNSIEGKSSSSHAA